MEPQPKPGFPTEVICVPPAVRVCPGIGACECLVVDPRPTPPPKTCTVSITYPENQPQKPTLQAMDCDQAGAELAIALILARLLGSP